ncbi:MAG TPA: hypothetical protein DCX14_06950 [Flavobacteriales bacterium]|jgi:hypothetical protein|nr:hypothetical protein [Flavobacteriales bacterium]
MRFQQKEYNALSQLIYSSEFGYDSFQFSKKRGILSVTYSSGQCFQFHRKETTKLDSNKQWTKHVEFRIWVNNDALMLETWSELEINFTKWLSSLNSST